MRIKQSSNVFQHFLPSCKDYRLVKDFNVSTYDIYCATLLCHSVCTHLPSISSKGCFKVAKCFSMSHHYLLCECEEVLKLKIDRGSWGRALLFRSPLKLFQNFQNFQSNHLIWIRIFFSENNLPCALRLTAWARVPRAGWWSEQNGGRGPLPDPCALLFTDILTSNIKTTVSIDTWTAIIVPMDYLIIHFVSSSVSPSFWAWFAFGRPPWISCVYTGQTLPLTPDPCARPSTTIKTVSNQTAIIISMH